MFKTEKFSDVFVHKLPIPFNCNRQMKQKFRIQINRNDWSQLLHEICNKLSIAEQKTDNLTAMANHVLSKF